MPVCSRIYLSTINLTYEYDVNNIIPIDFGLYNYEGVFHYYFLSLSGRRYSKKIEY